MGSAVPISSLKDLDRVAQLKDKMADVAEELRNKFVIWE